MNNSYNRRVAAIAGADQSLLASVLAGGRKGIEKECLRVDSSGWLSAREHPLALGSALTNNYITTDFSEALLEFVTPAFAHTWESLRTLCDIHQFTYSKLDDELLWPASMPCRIPADDDIPLGLYGTSNVGQMKTVYRRGLGYRYGRHMQTIAGVHFNYSLPAGFWLFYRELLGDSRTEEVFRSDRYMGLVRNFRRFGWILLYLFGASPALCKTFSGDRELNMPLRDGNTWYEPFGTSLRMSDLGYSNQTQARINISLNNLDEYVRDLTAAIHTPEPAYQKIGVKVDGEYRQLSANQLQIENEYYSSVRPKRVANTGERPTAALRRGGVEYVEIRSLDINIFDPCGVNQNTMRFIEAFLVYCVLEESGPLDDAGLDESKLNHALTARRGRDPNLKLLQNGEEISLVDWAHAILDRVDAVAELLDKAECGDAHVAALTEMRALVNEPDATPSARILAELETANSSFFEFAMSMALSHRDYFRSITELDRARLELFESEAKMSLEKQRQVEAADTFGFDEYLRRYFASD
ncbi:MAG TPA: glutamate--cysteine ligase [Woeseiaceae bacterium]|nr:glutamate--cysteine ligase [Woeseiaceae bacterium]